jgi:hypothetical protein
MPVQASEKKKPLLLPQVNAAWIVARFSTPVNRRGC